MTTFFPILANLEAARELTSRAQDFLLGVTADDRIEARLRKHGFSEDDFDEGVLLVVRANVRDGTPVPQRALDELRGWFARWTRVARTALESADLAELGLARRAGAPRAA